MTETLIRWACGCLWVLLSLFLWHILVVDPESVDPDAAASAWILLWLLWLASGVGVFSRRGH